MKKVFYNNITKRIFSVFMAVFICSMTVGNSFYSSQVYAAEVVVPMAADAVWKIMLAFFASSGLATAAIENRDALIAQYKNQLDAEIATDRYIIDNAIQFCDSATNTIKSIPIDEISASLEECHDSAVDSLTGIYVKYCPALLDSTKSFVSSVVNKEIVVEGITEVIDSCVTSQDIVEQWNGNPFDYIVNIPRIDGINNGTANYQDYYTNVVCTYNSSSPVACYINETTKNIYGYDSNGIFTYNTVQAHDIRMANISDSNVDYTYTFTMNRPQYERIYNDSSHTWSLVIPYYNSFTANFPIFSSAVDAQNYLHGVGAVSDALNYSRDITDNIIDNNDLPTIGNFANELWARIAESSDIGIGSYGVGVGTNVNDWADDIPFVGLNDLQGYTDSLQDIYEKTIDDIINGVYDPTRDIPTTYEDAWEDVLDRTWDDIVDSPVDTPVEGDTDIPIDDSIDTPASGTVDENEEKEQDNSKEETIEDKDIVPKTAKTFGDISGNLKYKFPFCIPWDLYYLLSILADTPKTPIFKLPLVIERYGIHEDIIIDMSHFEGLSKLSRMFFTLIYIYGLMNWTVKIVTIRKEE